MAEQVSDLSQPFKEVFEALDTTEQRKAMRSAIRRNVNKARKVVEAKMEATKLGRGTNQRLSKSLRVRIYPDKYGLGAMITTKPRGKRGYHKNRFGKEKPVAMWAEDGTVKRTQRRKGFWGLKKGRNVGAMPAYHFLRDSEEAATHVIEENLFHDFQKNLEKRLRKKNLL